MPNRQDLTLSSPWMNAAGSQGFAPAGLAWNWPEAQGAFVSAPLSLERRTPAHERAAILYEGGALLHSGWPNPGLRSTLRRYAERWGRSTLPVWVHLLAQRPDEVSQMVRRLEEVEGVAAVELGLPPEESPEQWLQLVTAAQGELPLVVCIPLTSAGEAWVKTLAALDISAVCLASPRGTLPDGRGGLVNGRLTGSGLFPLALEAVQRLHGLGIPIIAGCGVDSVAAGASLLQAGAWAVQVDAALWR